MCRLQNPMGNAIVFRRHMDGEPDLIGLDYLFTIISVPHRIGGDNRHYAWGFLSDGRLGFIDCRWLIEVRDGDK
jgi:hypothetical protein